jgi:hypothetical protein
MSCYIEFKGSVEQGVFMAFLSIDLSGVADSVLVGEVERLCKSDRALSALLIVHLGEVLARRLFLELGFSSMFDYCRAGLGMSEAEAYLRIQAAKVGREFPLVLERLGAGELHLTAIKLLAPHLTVENHAALIERVRGLSKRKIEEVVAELAPKDDVPSRVRKLPEARVVSDRSSDVSNVPQGSSGSLFAAAAPVVAAVSSAAAMPPSAALSAQAASAPPSPASQPSAPWAAPQPSAARATPLRPGRFKVEVTLDQEEYDALEQLRELLRHQVPSGDIARVVGLALKAHCRREMKRRFAQSDAGRGVRPAGDEQSDASAPSEALAVAHAGGEAPTGSGTAAPSARSRYIPRAVVRAVFLRDLGQCTFVSAEGRRCSSRGFLEVHHHSVTFARGGAASVENLRLVCRAHNLLFAERDYGRGFVEAKLREAGAGALGAGFLG